MDSTRLRYRLDCRWAAPAPQGQHAAGGELYAAGTPAR